MNKTSIEWDYCRSQQRHSLFFISDNKELEFWIRPTSKEVAKTYKLKYKLHLVDRGNQDNKQFIKNSESVEKLKEFAERIIDET